MAKIKYGTTFEGIETEIAGLREQAAEQSGLAEALLSAKVDPADKIAVAKATAAVGKAKRRATALRAEADAMEQAVEQARSVAEETGINPVCAVSFANRLFASALKAEAKRDESEPADGAGPAEPAQEVSLRDLLAGI